MCPSVFTIEKERLKKASPGKMVIYFFPDLGPDHLDVFVV